MELFRHKLEDRARGEGLAAGERVRVFLYLL